MQFKKIISLCKREKKIILLNEHGKQWIGNGAVFFCLDGYPELSEENIFRVFDIKKDEETKYLLTDSYENEAMLDFSENGPAEYDLETYPYIFGCHGGDYMPIFADGELHLLDTEYLSAFGGGVNLFARRSNVGQLNLFAHRPPAGRLYVAVRRGIFLEGLITLDDEPLPEFEKWINAIHERITKQNAEQYEKNN